MDSANPDCYPKVAIILISQDKRATIADCLEAILTLDYPAYEIIIVDHHTVRPEWVVPGRSYPPIVIVQSPYKLGIASARNLGIAQLSTREVDYIFHLDNDILVKKDCLQELVSTAQCCPQIGLVAPKIYQNNGRILSEGGRYITILGQPILLGLGKQDYSRVTGKIRRIDFATGALGLVRKTVFTQVGLFDTRFDPYGFEDIDWCLRIRKAGFQLVLNEKAIVTHLSDYSFHQETPTRLYETTKKRVLLAQKHLSPPSYYIIFVPFFFLRRCLLVVIKLGLQRKWSLIPVVLKATRETLTRRL
jgi:hypothetical protein